MRRFHFVKPLYLLLAIAISVISALGFSACNKEDDFYSHDNSFDISVTDAEDALIYEPQNIPYRYGLVFYVGTRSVVAICLSRRGACKTRIYCDNPKIR